MSQNNATHILGTKGSAYDSSTAGDVSTIPNPAILDSTTTTKTTAMMSADADASGKRERSHLDTTSINKNSSSISHSAATAAANSSDTNISDKPTKKKTTRRINWAKSPHRERLSQILHDWFSRTGLAVNATTGEPITDYRVYAKKVGISRTTLFNYIRKDESKRRIMKVNAGRGKKRLIDEEGIQCIIAKLKAKADVSNGFSRQEAISMIVEQFGISRKAATRQLMLHVLPMITINGSTLIGTEYRESEGDENSGEEDDGDGDDWIGEKLTIPNSSELKQPRNQQSKQQQIRSIVISGVTTGRGRELFEYFCNHGHNVAGCGVIPSHSRALQIQFPQSKLDVVDTTDFEAVEQWASDLDASGMDIDLVIANVETFPGLGQTCRSPVWEVTRDDFDRTMDANVKGIFSMIRNFVPKLIQKNNNAVAPEGVRKERVFVAMLPNFGAGLDPFLGANCASALAVEGLMRCTAMSIPEPLSAVTFDSSMEERRGPHEKLTSVDNEDGHSDLAEDACQWANIAAPMILRVNRVSNGKFLSIKY